MQIGNSTELISNSMHSASRFLPCLPSIASGLKPSREAVLGSQECKSLPPTIVIPQRNCSRSDVNRWDRIVCRCCMPLSQKCTADEKEKYGHVSSTSPRSRAIRSRPVAVRDHPMQTSHQRNLLIPTDIVLEWTVGAVPGTRLKSRSGLEREFAPCWRRSRVASSRVEV